MDVIFETQKNRPFSIEVGFFDTVLEIKEKIQKYQGIPVNTQTLLFNGQVLQDEKDVEFCEILQNSRLQLVVSSTSEPDKPQSQSQPQTQVKNEQSSSSPTTTSSKKIQLNVDIPNSSKSPVPIEMDVNDTVSRLKEKIHEMEPVPVNRLAVQSSGGGSELADHRSLRDCELTDNTEIEVNIRPSPTGSGSGSGSVGTTAAASGGAASASANTSSSKKLKLMVLPKCGTKKIPVEVNGSDNVGELRKELQKLHQRLQFNLPQEGYFFIYKQNVMDDDRSFRWHQVAQGDTIEIFNGSVTGGS